MTLGKVRARLLLAGAWLLGATAATTASLLVLGRGIIGPPSQQLTVAAVNRALASEAANRPAAPRGPAASLAPDPSPSRMKISPVRSSPGAGSMRSSQGAGSAGSSSPGNGSAGSAIPGTLLTSSGGNVVAGCAGRGAYLLSWSPQQGYEAAAVVRGPWPVARVTFRSGDSGAVTMKVTCHDGKPAATSPGDSGWQWNG